MPTFSNPSSRALLLMESALLIVIVRKPAGGPQLVPVMGRIERRAAVGRDAPVADGPLAREDPEHEIDQSREAEHADGEIDVAGPENPGTDNGRDDDPEADVAVEILLDVEMAAAAEDAAVDDVPGRDAFGHRH